MRQAVFVEGLHDLSNGIVDLHDEVAISIDSTLTFPLIRWQDRRMGCVEGEVNEKWLARLGCFCAASNVVDHFLGDFGKTSIASKSTSAGPLR